VALRAVISKPGVYNLNNFRIKIQEGQGGAKHGEGGYRDSVLDSHYLKEIRLKDEMLVQVNQVDQ